MLYGKNFFNTHVSGDIIWSAQIRRIPKGGGFNNTEWFIPDKAVHGVRGRACGTVLQRARF